MNQYKYDEIELGLKAEFTVTVTEDMQERFRGITGDVNPLHRDDGFAVEKGFERKVAFGMLTASFLSTLAGVYIPGERSLIQSVEVKFAKPVYIGDTLTISGEVAEKDDRFSFIKLKVAIRNQKDEKVLRGTMSVRVF